jgi:hypothetical protein
LHGGSSIGGVQRSVLLAAAALAVASGAAAVAFAVEGGAGAPASVDRPPATDSAEGEATVTPAEAAPEPPPSAADPEPAPIFPATTRAGLPELQAAVGRGHQPWLVDPAAVAESYLRSFGLDPVLGPYRPSGTADSEIAYHADAPDEDPQVASVEGIVLFHRLVGGSIFYVVGQRSERMTVTAGPVGSTLSLDVASEAGGKVSAYAFPGPPYTDWAAHASARLGSGQATTLTLELGPGRSSVLVRVLHLAADGVESVAEVRLEPRT